MFNASLLAVTTSQVAAAAATAEVAAEEEEEIREAAAAAAQQQQQGDEEGGAAARPAGLPARASSLPVSVPGASRRGSVDMQNPLRCASLEALSRRASIESLPQQPALLSVGRHSALAVVPVDENRQPILLGGQGRQRSRNLGRAGSLESSTLGPDVTVILDEIASDAIASDAAAAARGGAAAAGGAPGEGRAATTAYVVLDGDGGGKGGKAEAEGKGGAAADGGKEGSEGKPRGCCARLMRAREVPGGELGRRLIGVAASSAIALALAFGLLEVRARAPRRRRRGSAARCCARHGHGRLRMPHHDRWMPRGRGGWRSSGNAPWPGGALRGHAACSRPSFARASMPAPRRAAAIHPPPPPPRLPPAPQALALVSGAQKAATIWGAPEGSPMRAPTLDFLFVRGATAPITVLLLTLQVGGGAAPQGPQGSVCRPRAAPDPV
jgi:hypothetical protein